MTIKKEVVFEAANQIVSNGKIPTQSAVRDFIGSGSFSTIGSFLRDWRVAQQVEHELAEVKIPVSINERVNQLSKSIWNFSMAEAEQRISGERGALSEMQELARQEIDEANEAVIILESEADVCNAEIEQLKQIVESERTNYQELEKKFISLKASLNSKVEGLESRLNDAHDVIAIFSNKETLD